MSVTQDLPLKWKALSLPLFNTKGFPRHRFIRICEGSIFFDSLHTNIKGCRKGNKSPTQLRVMAFGHILRTVLNGMLWPFWWTVVWCFCKLNSLQRRIRPKPQGKCDNPFTLTPFKRPFKGCSVRNCIKCTFVVQVMILKSHPLNLVYLWWVKTCWVIL